MKKCISCGVELDDDARFCGECGTMQQVLQNVCSNCGASLPADARFCGECGAQVCVSSAIPPVVESPTVSEPLSPENAEIKVTNPDNNTITVTINNVPFNLKLVRGKDYGTNREIADFFIGETPVTQALWSVIMGSNPSSNTTNPHYPVTNINSTAATSLLVVLQKLTGVKFELPTEDQWRYAYKGGRNSKGFKYAGSDDVSEIGWADKVLHPVGQLFANELGLSDMEGNVEELLKGNKWAYISADAKSKLKASDLSGMRLVINLPNEPIAEVSAGLQSAIASHQSVLIPAREAEILDRKKREEDEARKKAEEEARRKAAEEEAKARAEEEARLKAEEEARRKAEQEARKKAEREAARIKAEEKARLKAEKAAKDKAEKESKIGSLKKELSVAQQKESDLKKELDSILSVVREKKMELSKAEETIKDCNDKSRIIEKAEAELERRFNVVMTKRVEYGFFSSKGNKFDEVLMSLSGESKEQIKEWNSILKKNKKVTISSKQNKEEATHYKSVIDNAGGEAIIECSLSDAEYENQKSKYAKELDYLKANLIKNQESATSLTKEIATSEKTCTEIETAYKSAHLTFNKIDLEIKFLESNLSVDAFLKQTYPIEENRQALSELFKSDYEEFRKKEEKARLKAEQEAKRKAEEEEQMRIEAEQEEQERKAEELRKKAEKEMKAKAKGLALYSNSNGVEEAYRSVFKKKIAEREKDAEALRSMVNDAIAEEEVEWSEYLTDFYWDKSVLEYGVIDDNILVVRGKGVIPDVEPSKATQGHNKWHINPEFDKICNDIDSLVIIGNISKIGGRCFADLLLEKVVMCDSIETIGEECFSNNEDLVDVIFPKNLKEIKENAFKYTAIQHAFLPAGVKKIGKNAFAGCSDLETILVPETASIDKDAFKNCSEL